MCVRNCVCMYVNIHIILCWQCELIYVYMYIYIYIYICKHIYIYTSLVVYACIHIQSCTIENTYPKATAQESPRKNYRASNMAIDMAVYMAIYTAIHMAICMAIYMAFKCGHTYGNKYGHIYAHVYRHINDHVYGHTYGRVYSHIYGHVYGHKYGTNIYIYIYIYLCIYMAINMAIFFFLLMKLPREFHSFRSWSRDVQYCLLSATCALNYKLLITQTVTLWERVSDLIHSIASIMGLHNSRSPMDSSLDLMCAGAKAMQKWKIQSVKLKIVFSAQLHIEFINLSIVKKVTSQSIHHGLVIKLLKLPCQFEKIAGMIHHGSSEMA